MRNRSIQPLVIIVVLMLLIVSTSGCFSSDDQGKDDTRKGFDAESLSKLIPEKFGFPDPKIDPKPIINSSAKINVPNIIAVWYFEKNTVYKDYGGVIKLLLQNNATNRIYIYRFGIIPDWQPGNMSAEAGIYADVGKYIDPGEEEYIGLLYFAGPKNNGEFDYRVSFSLYAQNTTGAWNDCGIQRAAARSIIVEELPTVSDYETHYNVPQYYDKVNDIVDPTDIQIINLSRKLASDYSGPFNTYQVCALYDYVSSNVKYFTDPSNTENYWCTPAQTLEYGGDCEDHSTLLSSMIISLGGAVRMYLTDSHAFLGVYIGNGPIVQDILAEIRNYYQSNVNLFWLEDSFGSWLIIDSIGSLYPGGLPLGSAPIKDESSSSSGESQWAWGFTSSENLYIIDVKPKKY